MGCATQVTTPESDLAPFLRKSTFGDRSDRHLTRWFHTPVERHIFQLAMSADAIGRMGEVRRRLTRPSSGPRIRPLHGRAARCRRGDGRHAGAPAADRGSRRPGLDDRFHEIPLLTTDPALWPSGVQCRRRTRRRNGALEAGPGAAAGSTSRPITRPGRRRPMRARPVVRERTPVMLIPCSPGCPRSRGEC